MLLLYWIPSLAVLIKFTLSSSIILIRSLSMTLSELDVFCVLLLTRGRATSHLYLLFTSHFAPIQANSH